MKRIEHNAATGETFEVDLTPEEIAEAQARTAAETPVRIKAQIDALERAAMLPRGVREFMLMYLEASFTPPQLAGNPGYQNAKAFDNQIRALRDQL